MQLLKRYEIRRCFDLFVNVVTDWNVISLNRSPISTANDSFSADNFEAEYNLNLTNFSRQNGIRLLNLTSNNRRGKNTLHVELLTKSDQGFISRICQYLEFQKLRFHENPSKCEDFIIYLNDIVFGNKREFENESLAGICPNAAA